MRVSDKPGDARHPYGHAKVESVSALIETGLLFLTSAWIVKEGVQRLLSPDVEVETTWYALAVVLIAMCVDFFAAGLTYFAVRVSDKPGDARHPYGHAKVESVSALIETGLL